MSGALGIRSDIYPRLQDTLLWRRNEEIGRYVNIAYKILTRFFPSLQDFIEYLNRLDRESAELLLDVCRFYNIEKNYAGHTFLKFIMMISIFERLSISKNLPFFDWLVMRNSKRRVQFEVSKASRKGISYDSFAEMIKNLHNQYRYEFGFVRLIFNFFTNYFNDTEKISLITSFQYIKPFIRQALFIMKRKAGLKVTEYDTIEQCSLAECKPIESGYLPCCYDWKNCYVDAYGDCIPDIDCRLKRDRNFLERQLKETIDVIYDYRSKFVHRARSPPFSEEDDTALTFDVYNDRPILIKLTLRKLEQMLENSLMRYFDKKIPLNWLANLFST